MPEMIAQFSHFVTLQRQKYTMYFGSISSHYDYITLYKPDDIKQYYKLY